MPILIEKWLKKIPKKLYPKILENFDLCLSLIIIIRIIKKTNSNIETKEPKNPISSPIAQKIKSVLCSGM